MYYLKPILKVQCNIAIIAESELHCLKAFISIPNSTSSAI